MLAYQFDILYCTIVILKKKIWKNFPIYITLSKTLNPNCVSPSPVSQGVDFFFHQALSSWLLFYHNSLSLSHTHTIIHKLEPTLNEDAWISVWHNAPLWFFFWRFSNNLPIFIYSYVITEACPGAMVLSNMKSHYKRKVISLISYISIHKTLNPSCGPAPTLEVMAFTNFNLKYMRMLEY